MRVRGLQWLIIPIACMGCAGAPVEAEHPRTQLPARDVEEILLLVQDLVTKGACASDEFYSTEMMHRLFGSQVRASQMEGAHARRVSMHGFEQLIRGRKATPPRPGSLDGIWFEARKPINGAVDSVCTFNVTFHGALRGSDFKSVVRVLGPGWHRDHEAESTRNATCCLHSWNPTQVPSGRPMGHAIIRYPAGPTHLVIEFDGMGALGRITAAWPLS